MFNRKAKRIAELEEIVALNEWTLDELLRGYSIGPRGPIVGDFYRTQMDEILGGQARRTIERLWVTNNAVVHGHA